jgi:hypothetical protein
MGSLAAKTTPLSPSCRLYEPEAGVDSMPGTLGQISLLPADRLIALIPQTLFDELFKHRIRLA